MTSGGKRPGAAGGRNQGGGQEILQGGITMAPDKIWVTTSEMTVLLSERRHDYDVAYIRKDALLEWLKEKGYEDTDRISVETIIDKINSL